MKKIALGRQGITALIDDEDLELASMGWSAHKGKGDYYYASHRDGSGARERYWLHNEVMQRVLGRLLESEELVDHINRDKLDCRRSNLRVATRSQNEANKTKGARGSSKYKGVTKTANGKWKAEITVAGKRRYLGVFKDEVDAAMAYNNAAAIEYGEFAYLNEL
jgi:hypothetical protein